MAQKRRFRTVRGKGSHATEAEGRALCHPAELVRQQRRVRGHVDDDRPLGVRDGRVWLDRRRAREKTIRKLLTHWDAGDAQRVPRAVVGLNENADGEAAVAAAVDQPAENTCPLKAFLSLSRACLGKMIKSFGIKWRKKGVVRTVRRNRCRL